MTGLVLSALSLPILCFAQVKLDPTLKPDYLPNFTVNSTSQAGLGVGILQLLAGSLIYLAGPIAILMIAIGGLRYVVSHGEDNQMEGAKKTITWAIIGLLVIIVSWLLVRNVIRIVSQTGQAVVQQPK